MYVYHYIMVTWSEVTDHVKLTGTDHHIKFDLEIPARLRDVIWHCRSSYCNNEKFIIYQVLSTLSVNIWDQLFRMFIYWRKTQLWKNYVLCLWADLWICTSLLCNFKADLETSTWNRFCTERCKWCQNTSRICFRKNIVYYTIIFKEGWYEFRKLQCSDTEHWITLCEINSIKSGYIEWWVHDKCTCMSYIISVIIGLYRDCPKMVPLFR